MPISWRHSVYVMLVTGGASNVKSSCYLCLSVKLKLSVCILKNYRRQNWRTNSDFVGAPVLALQPCILHLSDFFSHTEICVSLSVHQNLRKMEAASSEEPGRDLNELQNADWVGDYTPDLWPLASTDPFSWSKPNSPKVQGEHTPPFDFVLHNCML